MALATLKTDTKKRIIYTYSDESSADSPLTLNAPGAPPCRVLVVYIIYSAIVFFATFNRN